MQGGDIGTVMGCKTKHWGCKAVDRGALGSSSDGWQRSKRATQSSWNSTALDDRPAVRLRDVDGSRLAARVSCWRIAGATAGRDQQTTKSGREGTKQKSKF